MPAAVLIPLIALITFHWALPVAFVPALILLATVPLWLRRRAEAQGDELRGALGEMSSEVIDTFQGLRELVSFGGQRRRLALRQPIGSRRSSTPRAGGRPRHRSSRRTDRATHPVRGGHGSTTIGGHDVRQFPQRQLRELITVVPQDMYLFNTTMTDNIALGDPVADQSQITHAAQQALAHEFICALPEGYANESPSPARCSRPPRCWPLTRAVSSLDAENELAIRQATDAAQQGRTTLVIAHRLSTIQTAERVVMLDHGRVVDSGSHHELLATVPDYTRTTEIRWSCKLAPTPGRSVTMVMPWGSRSPAAPMPDS